jgi:hemerythrin-like domain-containing protein
MASVSVDSIGSPGAAAGFDEPLELLRGCHDRIGRRCALLLRLADHVAQRGADADAANAAAALLRYFSDSGVKHHEDEERDLFPVLIAAAPASDRAAVEALTDALMADHRAMASAWADVEPRLAALAEAREAALPRALAERFDALYGAHIAREEEDLLPLARRLLDAAALERLGEAMAARRGVRREPGPSR